MVKFILGALAVIAAEFFALLIYAVIKTEENEK